MASVRLIVSLTRTLVFRNGALSKTMKAVLSVVVSTIIGWIVASISFSGVGTLLPGYQFGLILTGTDSIQSLSYLAGFVLLLFVPDFLAQRSVTYSGDDGPQASGNRAVLGGRLLLVNSSWPAPLWRVSLLGWLRNRNALLLLMWGASYGFSWMYFSKPDRASSFFLFCWMVQIFHSYLRGNLFGVDRGAVWLYYMFPMPVQKSLRAKNQTLSAMQGCMIAAVLLPGLLHPVPAMSAADWLRIACYAYSSTVLGEITGSYFSISDPEPIERSSQFSGAMTVGGFIVPFIQVLFLAVFVPLTGLSRRFLSPVLFWLELIIIPASLWFMRTVVLPVWTQKAMLNKKDAIMSKLSVFSS